MDRARQDADEKHEGDYQQHHRDPVLFVRAVAICRGPSEVPSTTNCKENQEVDQRQQDDGDEAKQDVQKLENKGK